ncbi:hypothetical protein QYE76_071816 [Lolium multiflorum]|uniref:Uncharacterized protein n=1 Tax=Lolium multiflorum TaxID=4521 RepID=A0AAD8SMB5_LOLMU|nr:hypothetical protein QYE76_071816 [Lolium multiflorum]
MTHQSSLHRTPGWFYEKNAPVPKLNTLAEEDFRTILRVPVTEDTARRFWMTMRRKRNSTSQGKPRRLYKAPKTAATRTTSQEPITKYMKKSPAIGPSIPVPPSVSHPTPQPSPPQADPSPPPAANTPPEIIPVSSGHAAEDDPKAKGPSQEEADKQVQGEVEVTSSEKAGEGAGDMVVFPKNFGDPADTTSTPKAYATKFFNKLTEAEKWELQQDLLNAMLNNAWGKPDSRTSEIQDFKKNVGQFCDQLICKQKEQQALHYELHKNIALQRRVTLSQAENIRTLKDENAELAKQLADAQGASSSLATASTELENLRSSYQELETKLKEAELKREQAEKQLAEKNSEHIREKGELVLKKNADSETIKRQQKELDGLRKFMRTAEQHWDLLNENIMGTNAGTLPQIFVPMFYFMLNTMSSDPHAMLSMLSLKARTRSPAMKDKVELDDRDSV